MIKSFIVSCVVALAMGSVGQAATFEFMRVPSISSMSYRATGGNAWMPAKVNGFHGMFDATPSLYDVEINGQWSTHDFTNLTKGSFVTVTAEQPTQWAFNYDTYDIGDEYTLWLPLNAVGSVPEPATLGIAGMALIGLGLLSRCR